MSLFSRLFRRQAPTPAPQPEQAPAAEQASPPDPAALAAQRAAEEEEALTAAIAAADRAARGRDPGRVGGDRAAQLASLRRAVHAHARATRETVERRRSALRARAPAACGATPRARARDHRAVSQAARS